MHDFNMSPEEKGLRFGRFVLYPQRRLLLDGDRPLRIGGRALDILLVLVESAGKIVSKEAIISRVWPRTFVEEINLRVHISALRRALGTCPEARHYIANVRQRGYSFVAYVEQVNNGGVQLLPFRSELPVRLTRIEGRDPLIEEMQRKVASRRLISIVGPGGVGKTTVALRVAQQSLGRFRDGVRFIDLSTLEAAEQLPSKVATELGLETGEGEPLARIAEFLRERQMLLVLDNCEHLIDGCARLAEDLLRAGPAVSIITTSRESLRTEGEYVQPLAALEVPPARSRLGVREALRYPAFRLFVRRAKARQADFVLQAADVRRICEICRRLGGMPLALELAAAQVDAQGCVGVLAWLDGPAYLDALGRRTAPARQQTLRASLDWSFALLDDEERGCLLALAALDDGVTLAELACAASMDEPRASASLSRLLAKSLISVEAYGAAARYLMSLCLRVYLREKLAGAPS